VKPACLYDIRFGHGLLKEACPEWPNFIAVTTPTAIKVTARFPAKSPDAAMKVEWLDRTCLNELAAGAPDSASLVVGIGGRRAHDASKVVAFRRKLPPILVPTVLSTRAIIHGYIGAYDGWIS